MGGLSALMGGGGFSGSSSATSSSGPVSQGGFVFSPKASTIPPVAWLALAAIGIAYIISKR